MASYTTIQGESSAEIVEKKSRFIGAAQHVETEEEALAFLESIKVEHRMARHHVYAYVLRSGRVRYSDDGEPQKTAGLPTLDVINHAGLTDIIVVTTRYFGGTLLGTGGLVRAYTQAAQQAIEAARKVTMSPCVEALVRIAYPYYKQAARLVEHYEHAKMITADFAAEVVLRILILEGFEEYLKQELDELTSAQVVFEVVKSYEAPF